MSFIHNYKIMNYIFFGTIIINLQQNLHFFITVKLAQLPIQLMVNIQSKKNIQLTAQIFLEKIKNLQDNRMFYNSF